MSASVANISYSNSTYATRKIQAFIYDSTTIEYQVGKDIGCKLKTVGKRIAESGYGVAFPKKSQWLDKVNRVLLQMQEDGTVCLTVCLSVCLSVCVSVCMSVCVSVCVSSS